MYKEKDNKNFDLDRFRAYGLRELNKAISVKTKMRDWPREI